MAKRYTTKNNKVYIALSNEEKIRVYAMGATIIKDVAERIQNGALPKGWNKIDENALEIPLLCEPLEQGGKFIDLDTDQIHKLEKALKKLYKTNFKELFGIEIESGSLTAKEVRARMDEYRAHKKRVEVKTLAKVKADDMLGTDLFEW